MTVSSGNVQGAEQGIVHNSAENCREERWAVANEGRYVHEGEVSSGPVCTGVR